MCSAARALDVHQRACMQLSASAHVRSSTAILVLVVQELLGFAYVSTADHQLALQPPLLRAQQPILLSEAVQGCLGLHEYTHSRCTSLVL